MLSVREGEDLSKVGAFPSPRVVFRRRRIQPIGRMYSWEVELAMPIGQERNAVENAPFLVRGIPCVAHPHIAPSILLFPLNASQHCCDITFTPGRISALRKKNILVISARVGRDIGPAT